MLWVLRSPDGWQALSNHNGPVRYGFKYKDIEGIWEVIRKLYTVLSDIVEKLPISTTATTKAKQPKKKLVDFSVVKFSPSKLDNKWIFGFFSCGFLR